MLALTGEQAIEFVCHGSSVSWRKNARHEAGGNCDDQGCRARKYEGEPKLIVPRTGSRCEPHGLAEALTHPNSAQHV